MKVDKYKKMKNGMYQVSFDNGAVMQLYEEVILQSELLLHKDIDNDVLKKIEDSNKYYDCYYCALKYIKVSARTKQEVVVKLKNNDYDIDNINDVINKLEIQGYLNDRNYANSYLNSKMLTTNHGPARIRSDLEKKGIDKVIVSEVLEQYDAEVQNDKIRKIVDKQMRSNHNKGNAYLRRKLATELVGQGFDRELVNRVINNTDFLDDSQIRDREYSKLEAKLSKKYSGKELEYKIREKMAPKGFY